MLRWPPGSGARQQEGKRDSSMVCAGGEAVTSVYLGALKSRLVLPATSVPSRLEGIYGRFRHSTTVDTLSFPTMTTWSTSGRTFNLAVELIHINQLSSM